MKSSDINQVISGCGMHHISIQTQDWEASVSFFRDVLGMKPVIQFGPTEKPMMLLDIGDGSFVELVAPGFHSKNRKTAPGSLPLLHFALSTSDIDAAVDRVRQAGYEITSGPQKADLNGLFVSFAFFKGPNGEEIEFFQTH